jgi:hypothetical protein
MKWSSLQNMSKFIAKKFFDIDPRLERLTRHERTSLATKKKGFSASEPGTNCIKLFTAVSYEVS